MNEQEYLLTTLAEECAEVAQRACKALRFGLSEIQPGQAEDNKRRLEREMADLLAVSEMLGLQILIKDKCAKDEKVRKYMSYSREVGTLSGNPVGGNGNCSECGALVERLYSLRCPTCYDKLVSVCHSRYTHSNLGLLICEKDLAHIHRVGDVEHRSGKTIWMSI